ncbi:MAG: cytochrome P450 [Rhodobacteraceae bacterium]|nr:cytochrome P450 [Paracoccaceae bacterium]
MTPTSAREMPVIDIDPYADEHLADPSTYYDLLLKAGDVAYLSAHDVYVMGRHASIVPALKDWKTFSSTGGSGIADVRRPDAWRAPSPIVEVDPPRHTEVRRALQKVLSPAVIRKWREDFEAAAQALVAELLEKGEVDGVQDLSEAYVSSTFPDALGIARSPERRRNLYILGELNFDGQGPNNGRYKATQARADAIDDWYQAQMRREAMVPGGFGENIFKAADAGEIEPELAPLLMRSFLRGGVDTTSSTISCALHHLANAPDQFAKLREDPSLARNALEEAMRIETPIPNVGRLTMRDVEYDGVTLPADRKVNIVLGCANRDPEAWDRPDEYDLTRKTHSHVALGHGVHMCVGQMIARLEGESVLRAMATQVGSLEATGPSTRKLNNNLRSYASVPMRMTAG